MSHVDAPVIDVGTSENNVFLSNSIALFGIFAAIEPRQIHDFSASVRKVGNNTFLTGTYLKGLETEDMSFHLDKRHVAIQFADAV